MYHPPVKSGYSKGVSGSLYISPNWHSSVLLLSFCHECATTLWTYFELTRHTLQAIGEGLVLSL